jgi:hypothetical protein
LIDLLSKDEQGNPRFCNIREYVLSNQYGIPEKLSEFFCNILEDNRPLIDIIYNKLPIEVTNEEENRRLNRNINLGRAGGGIGGGFFFGQMVGGIFWIDSRCFISTSCTLCYFDWIYSCWNRRR